MVAVLATDPRDGRVSALKNRLGKLRDKHAEIEGSDDPGSVSWDG
jgi:hypothetical protein